MNEGSTFEDGLKNQLVVDAVFQSTKKENGLIYKNGFFKQKYPYYWSADGLGFAVSKAFSEKKANLFLLDIDHKKLIKIIFLMQKILSAI